MKKPEVSSGFAQKELDKAEAQFDAFDKNIKEIQSQQFSHPHQESEGTLSQSQINKSRDIYLKPKRTIASREKFNERFREDFERDSELTYFYAENKEIVGEKIPIWTKPYPGVPAEEWEVPVNTPVWGPKYLANQIKRKAYTRLSMKENVVSGQDGMGTYFGTMIAESLVQRLDAHKATKKTSMFLGNSEF